MVGSEQEDEQRLLEAAGDRRSLDLRGDESPDGQAFGSLMRVFRQFLDWTLAICEKKGVGYARHRNPPKEVIDAHPTNHDDTGPGPLRATVLHLRLAACSTVCS